MASRGRRPAVLLVEDDPAVRALVREILESADYGVLEAATASEALAIEAEHTGPIDFLITDVGLPAGMGGFELARELLQRRPGLKVVYTSGHPAEALDTKVPRGPEGVFVAKPFRPAELLGTLRRALAKD